VSEDGPTIRKTSRALWDLVLGWERYREAAADELGIGPTEVAALGLLYHSGPHTPSDIGQRLNLTSGSVTALLDRLEGAAFVSRTPNPDDRRSLLVTLTPAGQHAMQWFWERIEEVIAEALGGVPELSADDLATFGNAAGTALAQRARESREQRR
jgi:DNA-binding MarR family transcriptional regulator